MSNITFVIFTFNEEARIEKVIKNFIGYGKVMLADDNSTDKTHEIARSYGCDILIRKRYYSFVENQEMVDHIYENINTDWIYWGFADEMLDKITLDKIQFIIANNKHSIINMDRKNYYYGKFCYDLEHTHTNKIFKKGAIDFSTNSIHGMGVPTVGKQAIYQMPDKFFIHHFVSNTAASYLSVINRYSDSEVEAKYNSKTSILRSLFYLYFLVIKRCFLDLITKKAYKAGFPAIALSELQLFYKLVKNMKYYEMENGLTNKTIEQRNDVYRNKIISEI